jgi:predicted aspartyl protease
MNKRGGNQMGRVTVEVKLANFNDLVGAEGGFIQPQQVRRLRVPGVVDTGASYLVLPEKVATQLGVPKGGKATVCYADRRKAKRQIVERVELELLGRHGIFKAIVEPRRKDVLVGAIVLEDLDLLVDCRKQTLQPRDPDGYVAELD